MDHQFLIVNATDHEAVAVVILSIKRKSHMMSQNACDGEICALHGLNAHKSPLNFSFKVCEQW